MSPSNDLEGQVEGIVERLNEIRDECQEKLDNMPEALQSAPTGELLQERIDAMEGAVSEFEAIDFSDYEGEDEDAEDISDERQEWLDGKLEEIQGISIEAP